MVFEELFGGFLVVFEELFGGFLVVFEGINHHLREKRGSSALAPRQVATLG